MNINKLTSNARIPFHIVKGSVNQRQLKANELTNKLFKNINGRITDNYSIIKYEQLQNHINAVLPDKNFRVIVQSLPDEYIGECDGLCNVLYNENKDISAISVNLPGINNTIKSDDFPVFIHEFQHVSDDIFHPKYLSRLHSLNEKGLNSKKYDNFYDQFYYCLELVESKRDKKDVLKIIKNKTKKFLKGLNIEDKMDYIQDMRYSLMSEIEAYKKGRTVALDMKSKGLMVKSDDLEDYPKDGLFAEKINLLKELALEYITKERSKNLGRLNKSNLRKKGNSKF